MELVDGHERVPADCQALVERRRRWWCLRPSRLGETLVIIHTNDHSRSRVGISKSGGGSSLGLEQAAFGGENHCLSMLLIAPTSIEGAQELGICRGQTCGRPLNIYCWSHPGRSRHNPAHEE